MRPAQAAAIRTAGALIFSTGRSVTASTTSSASIGETGLHLEREAHRLEELRGLLLAEAEEELAREERAEDGGRGAAFLRREVRVPGRRAQAVALPRHDLAEDLAPRAQLAQPLDGAHAYFFEPRGT